MEINAQIYLCDYCRNDRVNKYLKESGTVSLIGLLLPLQLKITLFKFVETFRLRLE